MLIDVPEEVLLRLKADAAGIRAPRERLESLEKRNLRWVGQPNGWRTMGQLADDLEALVVELPE